MASVYIVLLRGINLGGKNRLPMSELKPLLADLGCAQVRTYLQSGNVLVTITPAVARRMPKRLSECIADRFGITVPVVMRSAGELRRVASSNPYLTASANPKDLHVAFLEKAPDSSRAAKLDPSRSPGDDFKLRGREIYLSLPGGVAKSKLTNAYFDATLNTISTMRTWRTVLKLDEIARQFNSARQ